MFINKVCLLKQNQMPDSKISAIVCLFTMNENPIELMYCDKKKIEFYTHLIDVFCENGCN